MILNRLTPTKNISGIGPNLIYMKETNDGPIPYISTELTQFSSLIKALLKIKLGARADKFKNILTKEFSSSYFNLRVRRYASSYKDKVSKMKFPIKFKFKLEGFIKRKLVNRETLDLFHNKQWYGQAALPPEPRFIWKRKSESPFTELFDNFLQRRPGDYQIINKPFTEFLNILLDRNVHHQNFQNAYDHRELCPYCGPIPDEILRTRTFVSEIDVDLPYVDQFHSLVAYDTTSIHKIDRTYRGDLAGPQVTKASIYSFVSYFWTVDTLGRLIREYPRSFLRFDTLIVILRKFYLRMSHFPDTDPAIAWWIERTYLDLSKFIRLLLLSGKDRDTSLEFKFCYEYAECEVIQIFKMFEWFKHLTTFEYYRIIQPGTIPVDFDLIKFRYYEDFICLCERCEINRGRIKAVPFRFDLGISQWDIEKKRSSVVEPRVDCLLNIWPPQWWTQVVPTYDTQYKLRLAERLRSLLGDAVLLQRISYSKLLEGNTPKERIVSFCNKYPWVICKKDSSLIGKGEI